MQHHLKYFTEPQILRQIGPARLVRVFEGFSDDLKEAAIGFPKPDSDSADFFNAVATLAASSAVVSERLRAALVAIERLAAPESSQILNSAWGNYFPQITPPPVALDRVLELWFWCPQAVFDFAQRTPHPVPLPSGAGERSGRELCVPGSGVVEGGLDPGPKREGASITPPLHHSLTHDVPHANPPARGDGAWPEPVDGKALLDELVHLLKRFVVLPKWAPEALALWIVHTYAFELRDVSTYLGIESPLPRCGKTTLLSVLSKLARRALTSANISSPAFFRAIQELQPTLLIDEADTFLPGNDELRGILNAGYTRDTAFVMRVASEPQNGDSEFFGKSQTSQPKVQNSRLVTFSCWCPKVIARIGHLPETLADRCVIIRMHRKTPKEACERLRKLDGLPSRRQCARFVLDHAQQIASAQPEIPERLNDRAADIWEPLFALADLAGGDWPGLARQAALSLAASAQENNPIGSLLLDIFLVFTLNNHQRLFTRDLLAGLSEFADRPWMETRRELTDMWLAQQLRPYGVRPRTLRINDRVAKGYLFADLEDAFRRYIPKGEIESLMADSKEVRTPDAAATPPNR